MLNQTKIGSRRSNGSKRAASIAVAPILALMTAQGCDAGYKESAVNDNSPNHFLESVPTIDSETTRRVDIQEFDYAKAKRELITSSVDSSRYKSHQFAASLQSLRHLISESDDPGYPKIAGLQFRDQVARELWQYRDLALDDVRDALAVVDKSIDTDKTWTVDEKIMIGNICTIYLILRFDLGGNDSVTPADYLLFRNSLYGDSKGIDEPDPLWPWKIEDGSPQIFEDCVNISLNLNWDLTSMFDLFETYLPEREFE